MNIKRAGWKVTIEIEQHNTKSFKFNFSLPLTEFKYQAFWVSSGKGRDATFPSKGAQ